MSLPRRSGRPSGGRSSCPWSTDDARPGRPLDPVAVQRRTVRTLVVSQALGAIGITIGIATASLLARDISGSEAQSGLAQTFQVLGAAVASYLLARLMSRRGRRVGLVAGYLLGAAGGVLAVVAGVVGSMSLLLVGAVLLGSTRRPTTASRYAATDLAPERTRARALSTSSGPPPIGAVAGPNLTGASGWVADVLGLPELTGPFVVGTVGMLAAAVVLAVALRPDPLLTARRLGRRAGRRAARRGGGPSRSSASGRSWRPRWWWSPARTPR